jgi:hypothetical protein
MYRVQERLRATQKDLLLRWSLLGLRQRVELTADWMNEAPPESLAGSAFDGAMHSARGWYRAAVPYRWRVELHEQLVRFMGRLR